MSQLTLEDLRSRLALDYRAMRSLRGSTIGRIEAFVSPLDLVSGREATEAQGLAGLATAYRVEFRFPMRRSAREGLHRARAVFQVTSHAYPFAEPFVGFERDAIPFAPHIAPSTGHVCTGDAWLLAQGHWLLANFVIHVMKLANYDEPRTKDTFSQEAFDYAHGVLHGEPLNPDLDYPVIDEQVTHSGAPPTPVVPESSFRRSSGFAPRQQLAVPAVAFARRPSF
jgi:hypothetical protein